MDQNLVVLCGRLAAPAELLEFESGTRLLRVLISVRSGSPQRRVDVVPLRLWDPDGELIDAVSEAGVRAWAVGAVRGRLWEGPEGSSSRLEVVAHQIAVRQPESAKAMT